MEQQYGISFHMTQNNASEANDNGYGIYSNSVKDIAFLTVPFIMEQVEFTW